MAKKQSWREYLDEVDEKIHEITPEWEHKYGKGKILIPAPKDIEKMQSHLEKLKKDSEFYKHKKEMQDLQEAAKNVSKILVEAGNKYKEICKMMSDINPQFERIDEVMANAKVEYQVDPLCKICSIPMDGFWCSQLCGHIFCKVCLERLHKQPCPTCRTPIGQLLKVHI